MISVAAACACVCATAAATVVAPARAAGGVVAEATSVAAAQWPSSPCHGKEKVLWVPQAVLDADHVLRGLAGDALVATCTVRVTATARTWSGPRMCALLQHEFGHLAGRGHSADPHDVMYSGAIPWTRACIEAFPPPRARSPRWRCRIVPAAGRTFRWECRLRARRRQIRR